MDCENDDGIKYRYVLVIYLKLDCIEYEELTSVGVEWSRGFPSMVIVEPHIFLFGAYLLGHVFDGDCCVAIKSRWHQC